MLSCCRALRGAAPLARVATAAAAPVRASARRAEPRRARASARAAASWSIERQTVVVGKHKDGSEIRRHAAHATGLTTHLYDDARTLWAVFERSLRVHGDRPALGTRNAASGAYEWQTYRDVLGVVEPLGAALASLMDGSESRAYGIFSRNRAEWLWAELAGFRHSLVPVAIYETLGHESVRYVLEHADIGVLFVSANKLSVALASLPPTTHTVVVFEDDDGAADGGGGAATPSPPAGVTLLTLDTLLARGRAAPRAATPPAPDDTSLIMYTSGTTGTPKGVVHTHASMVAAASGAASVLDIEPDTVHLSYLPLAHIFERVVVATMLMQGAGVGVFSGDVKRLMGDIGALRPTLLVGVPRVWERIQDVFMNQQRGVRARLVAATVRALYAAEERGAAPPFWTRLVTNKARAQLGGRTRHMLTGGAPLAPDTQRFVRTVFGTPLVQGYGLTETCAATCLTHPDDLDTGTVGAPAPSGELRLVAVPEMGYDKPNETGGEIAVRGPAVAVGYHKNDALTRADFDDDGWFRTGDIARWTARGTLKIIDRKKNLFKTSLGEYVASEKIETALKQSRFAAQVFVCGRPTAAHIVAVVSVDDEYVAQYAAERGLTGADADVRSSAPLRAAVLADFGAIAADAKLQSFERVRAVHLDNTEWTVDNALLTPSFKLKRHELERHYKDAIDALYADDS